MGTKIEYLTETWNFMGGCSACSPGCDNCWACRQAAGRLKNHPLYKGLTKNGKWTGEIRLCTDIGRVDLLEKPLHWREPRRIGVQFMSDLFHPKVPFGFIEKVMAIIEGCPQHTFQVLTKRPYIMAAYFNGLGKRFELSNCPNLWLGVTVEHPKYKHRINTLRQIPAAVKYLSIEPCLADMGELNLEGIGQVIAGGESGPGARPMHPDWARGVRDQCVAVGVPFFFKQWGEWCIDDDNLRPSQRCALSCDGTNRRVGKRNWPQLEIGDEMMARVGKKKAGRLLDGREWNEMPKELR